jgi:tetratricopeptide (TPR) repeat protein
MEGDARCFYVEQEDNSDNDKAIRHIEEALGIRPDSGKAYGYLGWVHSGRGEYAKATGLFRKATELGSPEFYQVLGQAYFNSATSHEDYDNALKYFQQYLNYLGVDKDKRFRESTYYFMGLAFFEKAKCYSPAHYRSAAANFLMANELKDDSADTHYMLGLTYWNMGLKGSKTASEGLKHIERAAELNPEDEEVQSFLRRNAESIARMKNEEYESPPGSVAFAKACTDAMDWRLF